ncbi:Trimethyllysine dioxygenase [Suhomyces tanzawaensis NRRL Y-17324]|uniref:Trimethyllysine dioxygenase n=1 Tax=Suhomyces tanzawaensis NRRL Y-17324 TaxID=984487 RepID=A0A1E4SGQ8_9ASCO|nr:Trimethyllysine dioxygenase [Suhomyces tanzawaensis NRRL Y-17324]ODV78650.1 Trimethyllysine dioxygenase [Suhomyces tanzawaensis NRRL Y-17324]
MSIQSASASPSELTIEWADGQTSRFHHVWLRDYCHCEKCYFSATKQRLFNLATIDAGIRPESVASSASSVSIVWSQDAHQSVYDANWLFLHSYQPRLIPVDAKVKDEKELLRRQLWQVKDIEHNLPLVDFSEVVGASDDAPIRDWSLKIWKHGFCMIDNVPVTPEDTEKLCEALSYIRPTHYGGFWDFTSDLSKADTAYTNVDISCHTDGTYWSDTPGLQLFHLLYHDGTGGTTSLVDAFKCAEILRSQHPESFDLLTRIPIPAHSAGEEKVCIQPDIAQPVFKLDLDGNLLQVRWNQSDRSTMDNWHNPEDVPRFYEAIRRWVAIINNPENELFYQLKPGQCLIFDNWRCFHSRTEFTGKRRMCGAYINRDDFVSGLRLMVLGRDAVVGAI